MVIELFRFATRRECLVGFAFILVFLPWIFGEPPFVPNVGFAFRSSIQPGAQCLLFFLFSLGCSFFFSFFFHFEAVELEPSNRKRHSAHPSLHSYEYAVRTTCEAMVMVCHKARESRDSRQNREMLAGVVRLNYISLWPFHLGSLFFSCLRSLSFFHSNSQPLFPRDKRN